MAERIQLRHGTAAAWTSANPLLAVGETGVETDTRRIKIGDGATNWNSLPYIVTSSGGITVSTKTSNYNVLSGDAGTYFDNGGASGTVAFNLPAAASGLLFTFTVLAAQIVQVVAAGSDKIALGTANSAGGGNVSSNFPFSSITIYAPGGVGSQWVVTANTGGWDVN